MFTNARNLLCKIRKFRDQTGKLHIVWAEILVLIENSDLLTDDPAVRGIAQAAAFESVGVVAVICVFAHQHVGMLTIKIYGSIRNNIHDPAPDITPVFHKLLDLLLAVFVTDEDDQSGQQYT